MLGQVIGQVFGHALGQRGHQHAFANGDAFARLRHQVIHLRRRRAHLDHRIDQPGRAHQLLDHLPGVLFFVIRRGRRDKHRLRHQRLELFELERTIVQRGRQPKAIVDQIFLARTVAFIHAADLGHGNVRFVDDHQRVLGQIIDQRGRWVACLASG